MKRKAWKVVLGLFGGMALIAGFVVVDSHRRASKVIERHRGEVTRLIAEIRARSALRPVMGGEPIQENGWNLYREALKALELVPETEFDEIPEVNPDLDYAPDAESLDDLFVRHAGLIELLSRTTRTSEFRPDYRYEEGMAMVLPEIPLVIRASRFLAGAAQRSMDEGRARESFERWIPIISLGHDTGRQGILVNVLVQLVCEGIAVEKAKAWLAGEGFQPEDLAWLAAALDLLAAARPSMTEATLTEEAVVRQGLLDPDGLAGNGAYGRPRLMSLWRYLFSHRIAVAQALNEFEIHFRKAREAAALPVGVRAAALQRAQEEILSSRNPLVLIQASALARSYRREAISDMNWVLMRCAVGICWFQAERGRFPTSLGELVPRYLPAVPACPYSGKPLCYSDGKVWSVGGDGKDDGGKPLMVEDDQDSGGDVVWTVKRK